MRIVLYQPDIAQNTGAIIRLAACFSIVLDIIEPCGFVMDDRKLARAALDYGPAAMIVRHRSWQDYLDAQHGGRLILLTTRGATPMPAFRFLPDDNLLFGRESAGVPDAVHAIASARIAIPMAPGCRSLNVAQAAAIVVYMAAFQTD